MGKKRIIEIEEFPGQGENDMSTMELMKQEYGTWDEHDADYYDTKKIYKKKVDKVKAAKGGLFSMKYKNPVSMATGGLMSMPPYIAKQDEEKDEGITPYDVNTPESARQGMPSRLLSKSRTRFFKGDVALLKRVDPNDFPDDDERDPNDGYPLPGDNKLAKDSVKDQLIQKQINKLEAQKEILEPSEHQNIDNQIQKLESMKSKVKAATGGYMDGNQIAEETPLALNIGGAVGRRDERKDYQAYAEGDMVEDESLLTPMGMEEEDAIAETDMEMEAEENYDSVLDTSALSEEEENLLDEAIEMHPELEAIIPKIVATEFTEDELVEGPGDGTSDSIPALLSDGEFVFTAKAVKNIGVDKLRKMMAQAEEAYDAGQVSQEEDATAVAEADSLLV